MNTEILTPEINTVRAFASPQMGDEADALDLTDHRASGSFLAVSLAGHSRRDLGLFARSPKGVM